MDKRETNDSEVSIVADPWKWRASMCRLSPGLYDIDVLDNGGSGDLTSPQGGTSPDLPVNLVKAVGSTKE